MAQTALGAAKGEASRRGMTLEGYLERRKTDKWCTGCKDWHSHSSFDKDRSRGDGLKACCRDYCRIQQRIPSEIQKPKGPRSGRHSDESKNRMRDSWRRRIEAGIPSPRLGIRHTLEARALISQRTREKALRGKACPSFKDGKSAERRGERFSARYKQWRFDVFMRDRFTCQLCSDRRGGNLHAHQLKSFAEYPDLRFDLSNGLTLCHDCHKAIHAKKERNG